MVNKLKNFFKSAKTKKNFPADFDQNGDKTNATEEKIKPHKAISNMNFYHKLISITKT